MKGKTQTHLTIRTDKRCKTYYVWYPVIVGQQLFATVAYAGKNLGVVQGRGSGLVGGPGGGAPPPGRRRIFENSEKNSGRKLQTLLYFRLICKNISQPRVKFSRVWTKNTIIWGNFEKIFKILDENSMEKSNFYLFFGKSVAKNRNFGNNIIFPQHFFRYGGV